MNNSECDTEIKVHKSLKELQDKMKRFKIHQRESNKDSIVIATVTEFSTIEET